MNTLLNLTFRKILALAFVSVFFPANQLVGQIFIEAEDYSAMKGIEVETTSDIGGGLNVGWIDNTDWLEYEVNIPMTGDYKITLRAAGEGSGLLRIIEGNQDLDTISIASTGGWQAWTNVDSDKIINFTEGVHTLRLYAEKSGFNLNWWKLTMVNPNDNDKPSKPNILSSNTAVHSIELHWNKANDATSAIAGYKILNNNIPMVYVVDTFVVIDKLAPNKMFNIGIVATDLVGNISDTAKLNVSTDTLPWDLQWSDEFDYTGPIDAEKWFFETGGDGWGNNEAQYYTNGDNATVKDGTLIIEARKENLNGNDFTSSRINSRQEFDFLYGRIEVKAKLPRTNGTWPAIWTLPTNWVYGGWPDCGEIDIMEHSATYNYGHVFGTVHTGAYNHIMDTQKGGGITFDDVTDTYHTYAIEWYPDHIDWYVDDIHIFQFDNEYKTTAEWPYDIPHHLLLNVAIGGGLGGDIDYNGVWPQQMIIDYVRVYDFKLSDSDTIPPSAPLNLTAQAKWSTIDFSWDASTDNFAVKNYYVYMDDKAIDTVSATNILIQGLDELTEYELGVQAVDFAGNVSEQVSTTVQTIATEAIVIPGKIEAENYTLMSGIQTEKCTDTGGGENVGYIESGDWLTYTIDVAEEKEYRVQYRVASQSTGGAIQLLDENENELTGVQFSGTGGWQKWKSVLSEPFVLSAGIQTVKLATNTGGFNVNWLDIRGKDDFVNVAESLSEKILVYPNPISGNELNVAIPTNVHFATVNFYSADGKLLLTQQEDVVNGKMTISTINLNRGVYVLSVVANEAVYTQIIKKL